MTNPTRYLDIFTLLLLTTLTSVAYAGNKNLTGIDTALISDGQTFTEAQRMCDQLYAGGFSDWRLPTLLESKTLHEAGVFYGLSPQVRESWTSTEAGPGKHAVIWMFNGNSNIVEDTRSFRVYCVRIKEL